MRFTSFREMLAFYAGQSPQAPALFYENENRPAFFTYGQLHFLAKQQEYLYRVWGGTCLAFVPDLSRWTIAAFFGAVSAGLPVVLLDPNAPGEDLAAAIRKAKADRIACRDRELREELSHALTG